MIQGCGDSPKPNLLLAVILSNLSKSCQISSYNMNVFVRPKRTDPSKQIIFIGLRSSKDYHTRPGGVVGVYRKGHLGVSFFTWVLVS